MKLTNALFVLACAVAVFTVGSLAGDIVRLVTPFDSMPLWLAGGWISLGFTCGYFFSILQRFFNAHCKRNTPC